MSNELRARVTADTSDYNRKMKSVGVTAVSTAKIATAAISSMVAATAAFGVASIKTAIKYEQLQKRMQATFGKDRGLAIYKEAIQLAKTSSLETDKLADSYITLSNTVGKDPGMPLVESIGFFAKTAGANVNDLTRAIGRMLNKIEKGELLDKDLRDRIQESLGVGGKSFMNDVVEGANGMNDIVKVQERLIAMGKEQKAFYDTGIGASISRLSGTWDEFLLNVSGSEEVMKSIEDVITRIGKVLEEFVNDGGLEYVAKSLKELFDSITADDIKLILELMVAMLKVVTAIAKNWKKLLFGGLVLFDLWALGKLFTLIRQIQMGKRIFLGGLLGGAGGAGGLARGGASMLGRGAGMLGRGAGMLGKAAWGARGFIGTAGIFAGVGIAGFKFGEMAGKKIAEKLYNMPDNVNWGKADKKMLDEFNARRIANGKKPLKVEVISPDGKNVYE